MSMFDQLKPIMQNGERYIVVEGGKPEYVLMRFHDYVTFVERRSGNPGHGRVSEGRTADWERASVEFEDMAARPDPLRPELAVEPGGMMTDPTTIRLEDLPL